MATEPKQNYLNNLSPAELEYLQEKGFGPEKRHNVIRSVIHTPEDRQEADKIRAVLSKLPDQLYTHIIVNVIQPANRQSRERNL